MPPRTPALDLLLGTSLLVLLSLSPPVRGQEAGASPESTPAPEGAEATSAEQPGEDWTADLVESDHTIDLDGQAIPYRATAGTMDLRAEDGTERAHVFFVAYVRSDVDDPASRPITFCFNGGPGSSSVWLHLGAFGPRRVPMPAEATPPAPPYHLEDNPHCLLDLTDLVFIDPVSTGYSRAAEGQDASDFHGVDEDIRSVGEFIRLYTTRMQRWLSPKFLAGESYGTTRAAGLAGWLQDRQGLYLDGIILISSILDFSTARFTPGNDLPYWLFLPTYTATAFYHHGLADDLQGDLASTLDEVERFASGDYLLALAQGDALPDDQRHQIAARLARYTGLSQDFVEQTNLRIVIGEFCKELRRDDRRTVGRLDSRFTGRDADAAGATPDFDPSYAAIQGPFTATLNAYVRGDLGYDSDLPYEILTDRVYPWHFGDGQGYVDVAETLRSAMSANPHLRVFVANGYYDLATPFFATRYTFDHMGLEADLRDHVSMGYYEAGHMMYIHDPSATKLKTDIARFMAQALGD